NEAIELAKRFGGAKSSRFINGVMGAVYRELGEPGKDDEASRAQDSVPYDQMPIDQKGAAVVYSIDVHGVMRIGMVHDIFGYWTLSKGGIEEGETAEQGTIREVKEETNWDVVLVEKLGDNEYIAHHPKRGPVRKQVQYFLAKSEHTKPTLEEGSGGLDDVRWFELGELSDLNIYDDVSKMLIKSIQILTKDEHADSTTEAEEVTSVDTDMDEEKKSTSADQASNENTLSDVDLSGMNLTELKAIAKAKGLKGYSTLNKTDLLKLLSE
ncbi:MAG: NUDIX domain-containing protein, partial [Minisyncoccia bacterium]